MEKYCCVSVKNILSASSVDVIPTTRELFLQGLMLYESRTDKEYSHVDCISMSIMKNQNITDALTNDHHFEQEGFTLLLKK